MIDLVKRAKALLTRSRSADKTECALVRSLERDSLLVERVEHLMTIPAVGPITALTWSLEVGDMQRFSSIKKPSALAAWLCGGAVFAFYRQELFCRRSTATKYVISLRATASVARLDAIYS